MRSWILWSVTFLVSAIESVSAAQRPNIVFILADDLGWNDVSFHGSKQIPTPNLDALAYDGVILGNYYVQPLCTPTRAALMTGRYPIRVGLQHDVLYSSQPFGLLLNETIMPSYLKELGYDSHIVGKVGLQHFVLHSAQPYGLLLNETIMPTYLKQLGYDTHIVGKWHLGFYAKDFTPTHRDFDTHYGYYQGRSDYLDHTYAANKLEWHLGFFAKEYTPTHRGFDSHYGYYQGDEDYLDHSYAANGLEKKSWGLDFHRDDDVVKTAFGQYSTELFTQEAEQIIRNHETSKPLYLYMAHQAVHSGNAVTPLEAPWKYVEKMAHIKNRNRRLYAAMLSALDDSVGNITKALFSKGMLNNTIIVFSTDNGGAANGFDMNDANNWPLRGLKATLWEGGVHGTGFIWSPLLEKSGYISQHLLHVTDWLPTLLRAAGYDTSKLPRNLDGKDQWETISRNTDSKRTEILLNIDQRENSSAIRSGDMKLVYAERGYTPAYSGWWPPDQVSKYFYASNVDQTQPRERREDCEGDCNPTIKFWRNEQDLREFLDRVLKSHDKDFDDQGPSLDLHHSDVYRLLEKIGRDSNVHVSRPFVISCGTPPANASTNCKPWVKPCLYNVTADPCEFNNLADSRKDTVKALQERLRVYERESVPPYNVPIDDAGLPYHHNWMWVPWRKLNKDEPAEERSIL